MAARKIKCSTCKTIKAVRFFAKNSTRKFGYNKVCKSCKNSYNKIWYANNSTKHRLAVTANKEKTRKEVREAIRKIKARPCMDCGVSYPYYVMDFDHRDARQKSWSIGAKVGGGITLSKILKEIEKCDVVCSNCHRERTHVRKSSHSVNG